MQLKPLRVTFHLSAPWPDGTPPPHLDGLYAWCISKRMPPLAEDASLEDLEADRFELPFAKLYFTGDPNWVYVASCGEPSGSDLVFYCVGNRKELKRHLRSVRDFRMSGLEVTGMTIEDHDDWRRCILRPLEPHEGLEPLPGGWINILGNHRLARIVPVTWFATSTPSQLGRIHPPYDRRWGGLIDVLDAGDIVSGELDKDALHHCLPQV